MRRNFDIFDAYQPDCQNLTHQIFKAIWHLVNNSDHLSKYFSKIFGKPVSVKISPCQNFPLAIVW